MTDEQEKAIKMLEKFTTEHRLFNIKQADRLEENIETVLKMLEEKDKEIEKYKYLYEEALGDVIKKNENEILGIARDLAKLIDGTDEEILSVIRKYYEILKVDDFENKAKGE